MTSAAINHRPDKALRQYMAPLSELLSGEVTEVCVNRPGAAWTESSVGWQRHDLPELTLPVLKQISALIANFNKVPFREDTPYLSGTMPDRERVQLVMAPATTEGTISFTIRKPSMTEKSLEELEAEGSFAGARMAREGLTDTDMELVRLRNEGRIREFLELAVVSRKNILLAGATGSGKTTVMRALVTRIPHSERVITIEDAHELFMEGHPNKVHLFYRSPRPGEPGPTAQEALKSCMRMKPDRILLAELRGPEAWDYMDSLNTGHPGSLSSIHANGALDAMSRLVSLLKSSPAGRDLDPGYLQQMCFETIDVVLFYKKRKLQEVYFDPNRRLASSRVHTTLSEAA